MSTIHNLRHNAVEKLSVPDPIIGGKGWCVDRPGAFIVEDGPGVLRCIACTHTGSSYLTIFDSNGEDYTSSRPLFRLNPTVLGHWMLDLGFNHGLVFEVGGFMRPFATIVWMKKK